MQVSLCAFLRFLFKLSLVACCWQFWSWHAEFFKGRIVKGSFYPYSPHNKREGLMTFTCYDISWTRVLTYAFISARVFKKVSNNVIPTSMIRFVKIFMVSSNRKIPVFNLTFWYSWLRSILVLLQSHRLICLFVDAFILRSTVTTICSWRRAANFQSRLSPGLQRILLQG
jgi:hypothetical protein